MRTVAVSMSWAVELSVSSGVPVVGCGCPISSSAVLIGIASCAFRNRPPVSASAADAGTPRSVLHSTCTGPLGRGEGGVVVEMSLK